MAVKVEQNGQDTGLTVTLGTVRPQLGQQQYKKLKKDKKNVRNVKMNFKKFSPFLRCFLHAQLVVTLRAVAFIHSHQLSN